MISVREYIKMTLKKKKWTNQKLCNEINKIEEKLGDSRTTRQGITNTLNGYANIGPRWVAKVEKALDLPKYTLVNMTSLPTSREGKKELEELIKKIWN